MMKYMLIQLFQDIWEVDMIFILMANLNLLE